MIEEKRIQEIRFKGFDEAWEQRKLSELTSLITKGTTPLDKSGNGNINFIKIENIDPSSNKIISTAKITMEEHDGYLKRSQLQENDILFSIAGTLGRVTTVNREVLPANTNQALAIIRLKSGYLRYITTYLKGKAVSEYIKKNPTIGAQPNLSLEQVGNLEISFPKNEEQIQIGDLFQHLDNLITLHQRKLENSENLKKAMLQKLFPKEGEKYPRLRFAGFTDAWEQRKLGEHCEMFNGDRGINYPNASDMVIDGIPFINAGDLENGRVNLKDANKISREKYDQLGGAKLQLGDIVYCLRGTLGKNGFIDNFEEGTVASSLVAIRPKDIDGRYLFYILNSDIEYRQRLLCDEGAAQPNLSAKNLSNFDIPAPSYDEQWQISSYFQKIDNLITLHQHKLDNLENLKKALLQRMFI